MSVCSFILPFAGFLLLPSCVPLANCAALVEAELLIPVSVHGTGVGKPIYARVLSDWRSSGCTLQPGGILKGRVVAAVARSRNAKTSSLALVFDSAECAGRQMKPLQLTVIEVLGPSGTSAQNGTPPLSEAVGGAIEGGVRNVMTMAGTANMQMTRDERPATVAAGTVIGIHGVKLSVGTGPEGSSVLSATGEDVRIERGSRFYLASPPEPVPSAKATTVSPATQTPAPSPVPVVQASVAAVSAPVDDTETCFPPQCSIVLPDANATVNARAEASVSIAELGYAPRQNRETYAFDHEAAVAFVGPGELLCTFNPHTLVERSAEADATRMIRAVLVDVATMRVTRSVDWRVPDANQYLWLYRPNRVLVHVGDELRVYGPGLKLENRIRLSNPLAFLRASPSGSMIALGIVHERHSAEMHRQLESAMASAPEEDIEVRLLDGNLQPLGSWMHAGNLAAPVLSNSGELKLLSSSGQKYRIVEYDWNKQRRNVASILSACTPDLKSVPPDLIFVSGCSRVTNEKWCRVLRPDGKTILKTSCASPEMMQYASGNDASRVFALGVAEAGRSMIPGSSFKAADLAWGRISVYRAQDGGRIANIRFPSPAATEQIFAFSPNGDRLAVLSGTQMLLYGIPSSVAVNTAVPRPRN